MPSLQTFRSEVAVRLDFSTAPDPHGDTAEIGRRVADVIEAFDGVEVRVSVDRTRLTLIGYVLVPSDVTLEMLDQRAQALRERWVEGAKLRASVSPA